MVRRFNAKQKSKHVIIPPCKYYFSIIPSKNIHNSISPELQEGHIDELNEQSGFFTKLEESILKEGIINPILVSIGWAPPAIINRLPKEAQDNFENEFICFCQGGSRLLIAQKYNMDIPCIVSDFTGKLSNQIELDDKGIANCFKTSQVKIVRGGKGLVIKNLANHHLVVKEKKVMVKKRKLNGFITKFSFVKARKIKNPIEPDKNRMQRLNKETGFFDKLEASILKDGMRNPIVINAYIENDEIILENRYGGSRLMFAQKHDMDIACVIADFDNIFPEAEIVESKDIKSKFLDAPRHIIYKPHGLNISGCEDYHLKIRKIMDTVSIICVKWGTKYSPEYVNILRAMVKRNLSLPHKFFCYTDDPDGLRDDIEIVKIEDKLHGWWNKLLLFQKEIPGVVGKTLYLDLDVIIVNPIDELFQFDENFVIIEDWMYTVQRRRPTTTVYNSSVFVFEVGGNQHVWDNFNKDRKQVLRDNPGDQDFITKQIPDAAFFPNGWCRSFKWGYHYDELFYDFDNGLNDETKIVVFHGSPNPPEAINGFKRYPPQPWIKKYWKE